MTERFVIEGGYPLQGAIKVPGAKNAVLPELAACMLSSRPMVLHNSPDLIDVANMCAILESLGCKTERREGALFIDSSAADEWRMPASLSKELRSSVFLLGPILSRFGRATFTYPGGCEIGLRPIDLHLKGLRALGARIEESGGLILCDGKDMRGNQVHLDYPSVGATENIMMAAVSIPGVTCIHNAAKEPELWDLQQLLVAMGAKITGAGTDTIMIEGQHPLHGAEHVVLADRIVAGTYLVAAAITGGEVLLKSAMPVHLQAVISKLREMGCRIRDTDEGLLLTMWGRPKAADLIETMPHPGFPTDMQAQILALCSVAQGTSLIVENIFENRYKHAPELIRMGAQITIRQRNAIVRGVHALKGATVTAHDLRGGAALVLAGLCARGTTVVENIRMIDRGYQRLEEDLKSLNCRIAREAEAGR